jgi:hypothetical protein
MGIVSPPDARADLGSAPGFSGARRTGRDRPISSPSVRIGERNTETAWARALTPPIAAVLLAAVVLFAPPILNDPDTYWHLATGGWILDHGRVPHVDVFSYSAAGAPWVAHEWLSDVFMAMAWRAGGWGGMLIVFAAAAGATAWLLARRLSNAIGGVTLLFASVLAISCMAPSLLARPQLLVLPVMLLWVGQLTKARELHRAPPLSAVLLMTLWANLHGSFVLGLLVAGAFGLDALIEDKAQRAATIRQWGVFGVASLAATLLTPNGLAGLTYPFQILGMTSLPGIVEWRAADFSQPSILELTMLATLFVCLGRGVRLRTAPLLLLLGLLHMALQHSRQILPLAVLAPLILAEPLGRALGHEPMRVRLRPILLASTLVAAIALFAVRLAVPLTRTDGPSSPVTAMAHVPPDLARQPVFNDYGFGGYLIFKGVRPFIDGRSDMYGDTFTQNYFRAVRPDPIFLADLLQRNGVTWTVLAPGNPAVGVLERAGWRRLYSDRFAVVQIRPNNSPPPGPLLSKAT